MNNSPLYIVTGGTSGIGAATSETLLAGGADVIVTFRSNSNRAKSFESLMNSSYGKKPQLFQGDLTCDKAVEDLLECIKGYAHSGKGVTGEVGGLIHAAGFHHKNARAQHLGGGEDIFTAMESYYRLYALCFARLVEGILPLMKDGSGRIVLVTAPGCSATTTPRLSYELPGQGKAAAENLMRSYALRLAPRRITVNAVMPGITRTGAWDAISKSDLEKFAAQRSPMKELLQPSAIAQAIKFLLSDNARNITGTVLPVDGGLHLV